MAVASSPETGWEADGVSDVPSIHAVTDAVAVCHPDFLLTAARNMRALGDRGALHLRASTLPARLLHDIAVKLAVLQSETDCWLVINDRVDIALAVGARGAQLTSRSLSVSDAREVAPGIRIGASVHSAAEARSAERSGADWCIAGNVFATPSHPDREGGRLAFVRDIVAAVSIPVIAIGGVTPEDVASLLDAGAHGIATIRGAGWDGRTRVDTEPMATVLDARSPLSPGNPLGRYISEYDAYRRGERRDNPHDQRRPPRNTG